MPRDTVNRAYFLEVCKERDLARDTLRQVQQERDRLTTAIRSHPDETVRAILDNLRTKEPAGEL